MVEMTVLHIASPFAVTAPVPGSQAGSQAGDDRGEQQRHASQVQQNATANRMATTPSNQIDARDVRSTLMRTVDIVRPAVVAGGGSASVDVVVAAYQEDTPSTNPDTTAPTG